MKRVKALKKKHLLLLAVIIIALVIIRISGKDAVEVHNNVEASNETYVPKNVRSDSYTYYNSQHADAKKLENRVVLGAQDYDEGASYNTTFLKDYEGYKDVLKTEEDSEVVFTVNVEDDGLYNLGILYYPIEGKSSDIEREVYINDEIPFFDARQIILSRVWKDKESIKQDNQGNDIKPQQVEAPRWMMSHFKDARGYGKTPYQFYFTKGENTIKLKAVREPLVIKEIYLEQAEEVLSYGEVKETYGEITSNDLLLKLQGEKANYKSDPTLYPLNDRSSPVTEPYHPSNIRLNMVGSDKWKLPGQWIEWEVDIQEAGYYKIGIQQKQDVQRGAVSYRKLFIDGKVPFGEMEAISFSYNTDWKMKILGGEEPYLYYLSEGKHLLKLQVDLGQMGPILQQAEDTTYELNKAYRRILMLTGSEPDIFRDYHIEQRLPEIMEIFEEQSKILFSMMERIIAISGQKGSNVAVIEKLAHQLDGMAKDPESIPKRFQAFKGNVGALGTWLLDVREQPLAIDYITIAGKDVPVKGAKSSFFRKAMHETRSFLASFIEDYNNIGDVEGKKSKPLNIWVMTGRDQAQIIKRMVEDDFGPKTGINVNIRLVQGGGLLPATVSGRAPDVAMQVPMVDPVNFALRNAVADLTKFEDFKDVEDRFHESAIVPYRFNEGVYALPETQRFPVLFYRKDILDELGVDIPNTWEDVINILPEIQKNNMNFGLPVAGKNESGTKTIQTSKVSSNGLTSYAMFLYQLGGQLYEDEGLRADLQSPEAIQAFEMWTELYTSYKLPQDYDFVNRFRTGEMPIGISEYVSYNKLAVFAPEIRGLWGFTILPGTKKSNGTIDRSVASTGTNCIMLEQSEKQDEAWEYMKWWTSSEMQERFGREMESLMGAAARYPTANKNALAKLPWPVKDYETLIEQWNWVRGNPEVPGGYFVPRHLDNAFRKVVLAFENPRESLLDYVKIINTEIFKKRKEFGLPTEKEEDDE